uniref:Uncharacterized protein n=1 Tax=Sphaerodactylus townsendi TaxID=933632 RepID=A0ACB8G1A9_9SAUR
MMTAKISLPCSVKQDEERVALTLSMEFRNDPSNLLNAKLAAMVPKLGRIYMSSSDRPTCSCSESHRSNSGLLIRTHAGMPLHTFPPSSSPSLRSLLAGIAHEMTMEVITTPLFQDSPATSGLKRTPTLVLLWGSISKTTGWWTFRTTPLLISPVFRLTLFYPLLNLIQSTHYVKWRYKTLSYCRAPRKKGF